MDITAIMVSYKSEGRIAAVLHGLVRALESFDAEIIVVDNASGDRTTEEARSVSPKVVVIANSENIGYGRAVNQGLIAARGRHALILNDDVALDQVAIEQMISVLDSEAEIALVGPRIVDREGRPNHSARSWYPGWREEWTRLTDLVLRRSRKTDYPAGDEPIEVAWLVGACLLGNTQILCEAGGFNERFFLYGEDIDLGRRLKASGLRSVTAPAAMAVHESEVSTAERWTEKTRMLRRARGRDVYYRIWLSRPSRMLLNLRRAIGKQWQPDRLRFFLPRVIYDGPNLAHLRIPPPLAKEEHEQEEPS